MKNRHKLRPLIILVVILFTASFLNMSALADTTEDFPVPQLEEGQSITPPQGAPVLKPEGKSPMAGNLVYDHTININAEITEVPGDYTWDGSTDTLTIINPDKSYLITGTGTAVKKQIVVAVGVGKTVKITIKDVNIEFKYSADKDKAAFLINSGKVLLNLEGTNTLASGSNRGGVEVGTGREITISGTGSLTASSSIGAGIGGGYNGGGGTINISGGDVKANSHNGAGIGGGGIEGAGGTINISGGDVKANSHNGAGIGGGIEGAGGTINISGGLVTATSIQGAGIGGGGRCRGGAGGTINISGGDVKANSDFGAGIGGGGDHHGGTGETITISGGIVTANSSGGAGIGGGNGGDGGTITISGGLVKATSSGTGTGAGIGGGHGGAGGEVTISGYAQVIAESLVAKDVGSGSFGGGGGSLLVEGDAVLTLVTGNANSSGKDPTTTIEGNGIIIDERGINLPQGGITLVLDISADKTVVVTDEKATITVGVSGIHSKLKGPLGKVELLQGSNSVATLTDIKETNKTLTYEFTPTTIGEVIFTAQYTKSTGDFYKDAKSADLKVTVTINPPIVYKVVEIPSAKNNYTAKVDVDYLDFIGVTVDKKALVSANFTAWSGSTFVRLNKAYLNTLVAGEHTITISFKGGTATATFTKTAAGTGTGGTGSDITTYEPKPWVSRELAAAIKKADSNPATGLKDVVSVEAMFVVFSLIGSGIVVKKKIR